MVNQAARKVELTVRFEAQRKLNDLYMNGEIVREEWSHRFDELSSNRWNAEGPTKVKETAENL